ncbi:hypothetical protein GJAV_G00265730 [Gymnothorax javanicus]|nr:hypothetical protein GJAV_G00265730 [Gymnothorax javanicus]
MFKEIAVQRSLDQVPVRHLSIPRTEAYNFTRLLKYFAVNTTAENEVELWIFAMVDLSWISKSLQWP